MSNKKLDTGKLYHKLHQFQKRITRWVKNGSSEKLTEVEYRKNHLLEKIKIHERSKVNSPSRKRA